MTRIQPVPDRKKLHAALDAWIDDAAATPLRRREESYLTLGAGREDGAVYWYTAHGIATPTDRRRRPRGKP